LIFTSASVGPDGTSAGSAVSLTKGDEITQYLDADDGTIGNGYRGFTSATAAETNVLTGGDLTLKDNGDLVSTQELYILDKTSDKVLYIAIGENLEDYLVNTKTDDGGQTYTADMNDNYLLLHALKASTTELDAANGTPCIDEIKEELQLYDSDGNKVSGVALGNFYNRFGAYTGGLYTDAQATQELDKTDQAAVAKYVNINSTDVINALTFSLHVGADSDSSNKISTTIESMSAANLGIEVLKSSNAGFVDETGNKATDAIDVIAAAILKVSTQRAALGAVQNRLEHTIKNLDNVVENTTSAESQIRDTDMATEMVTYSNANILVQAGQAMLAQANQSNQGVLTLLG
jgi:flagellin